MFLTRLETRNFRNLEHLLFSPQPGINLISGENGSGKSSLLEAIYFLGTGKSFRTSKQSSLIQHHKPDFLLFSSFISESGQLTKVGVNKSSCLTKIKIDGRFIKSAAALARNIPIQILDPTLHRFIDGGPEFRRRFIEWGVFHVEPSYELVWKEYARNLAQRNAGLKASISDRQLKEWNKGLANAGTRISGLREHYLEQLTERIQKFELLPDVVRNCNFDYYQGWPKEQDFLTSLNDHSTSDREKGFTQSGPHRADLRLKIGKHGAREVLSRGQQKLLVSTLFLLQCGLVSKEKGSVILLIDDLISELDDSGQQLLSRMLEHSNFQTFITATNRDALIKACQGIRYTMFHVEHGQITQVV